MLKKIGICTGNISIGGQERMLIEFLKVLSPEKYDIELFIEEDKGNENFYEKEIPKYIKYNFLTSKKLMERIELNRKSKNPLKKMIYSIDLILKKRIAIKELKKLILDKDIIVDYNLGLLRTVNNLNLKNKKLIGWSHAGEGQILKNKKKHENIKLYDYIISVNETMRKGYEKNYSKYGIKMKTIENFIDEKKIVQLSKEDIPEKNLGDFILSVGSLTDNKNFESLIKGYKNFLNDTESKLNLVILGEGKLRDNLQNLIKKNNLQNRVFLLGNKPNPYKYLKKCCYYVQSSKQESFSLVLIEAMVFEKVLISKENIGSKLVLENGKYGILLQDVELELSDTLIKLENNKELKKLLSLKSKDRGKDFYKEVAQIRIEELIDNL